MSTTGRTRRWIWLAAAVVVVVGGLWLFAAVPGDDDVPWVEAEIGDLVLGVEIEGTLASEDSSLLGPPQVTRMWDYKITFLATEGTEVDEGEPVLAFDTTDLDRRLRDRQNESARAAKELEKLDTDLVRQRMELDLRLAEAEATRRKARLKVERPREMSASRELEQARLDLGLAEMEVESIVSQLETAEVSGKAQMAVLQAQKDRADRQVREIEDAIERMSVKAPRAGTVIYVTNWRGDKKKVGDSAWRGENIVELPDLRAMMAKGEVDEADAGLVEEGQTHRIRLDAHPDVEYHGTVASIWRTVRRKSWRNPIKVVRLDMALEETDTRRMRPGMRFRGTVETDRVEDVLLIPSHAVFPTPDGPVVYRRTLFGYEAVRVELGRRNEESVRILDGLQPGDRVAARSPEA